MGDGTLMVEHVEHDYPADESPLVAAAHKYEQGAAMVEQAVNMRTAGLALVREAAEVIGDPRGLLGAPARRQSQRRPASQRVTSDQVVAALPGTIAEVADRLGTAQQNVRGHLARLAKSGAVTKNEDRPATYYAAGDRAVDAEGEPEPAQTI